MSNVFDIKTGLTLSPLKMRKFVAVQKALDHMIWKDREKDNCSCHLLGETCSPCNEKYRLEAGA